ncbi:hypothetical protein EYZ11_003362 [Aspergillus tanneri]|uniref:Xylanolytic transcriptional activator regulatory domain-containing protein n=1 Tax=Aspergillus tanneri TaxID=1220188 RepID=A0A4S3JQK5_9EURO|nr:hypothetical protein EYZ11_003362 [Aspergillus tanneri]
MSAWQSDLFIYEIRHRLERLERLLERTISGPMQLPDAQAPRQNASNGADRNGDPSGAILDRTNETLSTDGYDGALLLEAEGGQSRWVSSLHYALLADEIHDVKMLLGDQARRAPTESPSSEQASTPFPFSNKIVDSLALWLPKSAEDCFALLEDFISNVDPMTRLVHQPSLRRRFTLFVNQTYGTRSRDTGEVLDMPGPDPTVRAFEPLALAIFYSAVNSLLPGSVCTRFAVEKETLLAQFQTGVEQGLGREGFLTTSSIEVLQAFVLLLSCQSREDDMSRAWTLLGLALRMALSQGLHREPSLFPSKNMDVVQIEIRRRLWHQICHLDFRSAEARGQEPTISDDDYTTLLPRNVNDDDLIEGAPPIPDTHSAPGFTDMTVQLIRLNGIHLFRRIIRSTYKLERRIKTSTVHGNAVLYPIVELQALFIERMAIGLAAIIEWRCWSLFWLRTPKQYRGAVVSPEIRQKVLEKSVSLIESMNVISSDKDAQRFQWHIGCHSSFLAIMHIVSELGTLEFQISDHKSLRSRALVALQKTVILKGREGNPIWDVIKRSISNCLEKNASQVFPLTPYPGFFPPNGVIPTMSTTTVTTPPQTIADTSSVINNSIIETSLPDLAEVGGLDMQDPSMTFDWVSEFDASLCGLR